MLLFRLRSRVDPQRATLKQLREWPTEASLVVHRDKPLEPQQLQGEAPKAAGHQSRGVVFARRMACSVAVCICAFLVLSNAHAQANPLPPDDPARDAAQRAAGGDPSFGPMFAIESIEIIGNHTTAERLIRRALPIAQGDQIRAGDPRMQQARYKVLGLGYFRAVDLRLRKGSRRGLVVLTVEVIERGTVVLEALYFGVSSITPWWIGAAVSERNFLGTGVGVGGGAVYAAAGDIAASQSQWAAELRLDKRAILGSAFGAHSSVYVRDAFEPYRVAGAPGDDSAAGFRGFSYRRVGTRFGLGIALTPLALISVTGRYEGIRAALPEAPTRRLPDGRLAAVELELRDGSSRVVSASVGLDHDTRADPVLPYNGYRLVLLGELSTGAVTSDYDFVSLRGRFQHWWPVSGPAHVVSMHVSAGVIIGDAPRFDRLYAADFYRLITPRAAELVVSVVAPRNLLGTGPAAGVYGELGGNAMAEYSYRLFRRGSAIYGGDLFAGAGVWSLTSAERLDDRGIAGLTLDLVLDAGLRLDTEIGIFELTFANALGRVPL